MPAPRHKPVNRWGWLRSEHFGPGAAVADLRPVLEGVVLRLHFGRPLDPGKAAGGVDPPPARRSDPDRLVDPGPATRDVFPVRHHPRAEGLSCPAPDRPLGDPRLGEHHRGDPRRDDPRRGDPRSHRRETRDLPVRSLGRTASGLDRPARGDRKAGGSARDEVVPAGARGAARDLRRLRRGCRPRRLPPRSRPGPARGGPGQIQHPWWSRRSKWRLPLAKRVSRETPQSLRAEEALCTLWGLLCTLDEQVIEICGRLCRVGRGALGTLSMTKLASGHI